MSNLLLDLTAEFPRNGYANRLGAYHLFLEEVAVPDGHKVLVEVDDNSALIVGSPQGILGQVLWPYPINLLNIIYYSYIHCLSNYYKC